MSHGLRPGDRMKSGPQAKSLPYKGFSRRACWGVKRTGGQDRRRYQGKGGLKPVAG